jgi:hypothetical protein
MRHVLPSDWNPRQQKVKPARPGKDNSHDEINKSLDKLQSGFKTFVIAEINTPTIYKDFSKGILTEKIAPKCDLAGSHTARKTFITNFYHNTKDINLTKKNAGITQDKTLRRYMGIDKEMEKRQ